MVSILKLSILPITLTLTLTLNYRAPHRYNKGELRFAQGRRPAIQFLKSNKEIATEVEQEVREALAKRKANIGNSHEDSLDEEMFGNLEFDNE